MHDLPPGQQQSCTKARRGGGAPASARCFLYTSLASSVPGTCIKTHEATAVSHMYMYIYVCTYSRVQKRFRPTIFGRIATAYSV